MLLGIAFPVIVSQAADTVMMLTDRVFLSRLGREHLAAAMGGGLTAFMFMTFWFGLTSYANALVAQHLGAGQRRRCGTAAAQALVISVCAYPLVLCCIPLGRLLFRAVGHAPLQQQLETQYFTIITFGAILGLVRSSVASFFSGVGRTRSVMVAAIAGMIANIAANYVLIFGKLGFPALGMAGAAYGTIIGGCLATGTLVCAYFTQHNRTEYGTLSGLRFDWPMMKTLLRFGSPSGFEFFANVAAFNLFVQMFHSYGRDVAAAITITFNWDMVAFIPMIGMNIATMSLVGRYMGANDPDTAEHATYSALTCAYAHAGTLTVLFLACPATLASLFAGGPSG